MTQVRFHSRLFATGSTRRALLGSLLGLCAFSGQRAQAESTPGYRVLVHPDNPVTSLSRDFVSDVFLKRTTRWGDGEMTRPVDQHAETSVRRAFSDRVLRRSVAAIKRYWQQRIFSGRDLPPPELENDEAVVGYVLKHRGAIGYVTGNAKIDRTKSVPVQ